MQSAAAHTKARVAGALWLVVFVSGFFAQTTLKGLYVSNVPAATAAKLLEIESTFRLGLLSNMFAGICYVGVSVLLYELLAPVSRSGSLMALVFGVIGSAVASATSVFQLGGFVVLKAPQVAADTPSQLDAVAFAVLALFQQGFFVGMAFFGLQCLTVGVLIARSALVPRILGVLLAIGGSSYIVVSSLAIAWPHSGALAFPYLLPAVFVGEGLMCLWLLVKGINRERWDEYVRA